MSSWPARRRSLIGVVLAALVVSLFPARAGASQRWEIPNVLVITKSSNRNQVNYLVEVDGECVPAGSTPVRPYWRMLERGPMATEPLSKSEQRVLGVESQTVDGHRIQLALRAMPTRLITIETQRDANGRCSSSAEMTIAGTPARVAGVFVQQKLFGIDYILLTGWRGDGAAIRERLSL